MDNWNHKVSSFICRAALVRIVCWSRRTAQIQILSYSLSQRELVIIQRLRSKLCVLLFPCNVSIFYHLPLRLIISSDIDIFLNHNEIVCDLRDVLWHVYFTGFCISQSQFETIVRGGYFQANCLHEQFKRRALSWLGYVQIRKPVWKYNQKCICCVYVIFTGGFC